MILLLLSSPQLYAQSEFKLGLGLSPMYRTTTQSYGNGDPVTSSITLLALHGTVEKNGIQVALNYGFYQWVTKGVNRVHRDRIASGIQIQKAYAISDRFDLSPTLAMMWLRHEDRDHPQDDASIFDLVAGVQLGYRFGEHFCVGYRVDVAGIGHQDHDGAELSYGQFGNQSNFVPHFRAYYVW